MLACEPLCLSTQPVISLRLKTLLKHVGFLLFLLNSALLLSVKSSGHAEFLMLGVGVIEFGYSIRDFFEAQKVDVFCLWCVSDVGCWSFVRGFVVSVWLLFFGFFGRFW
jgi:hypothetical protein